MLRFLFRRLSDRYRDRPSPPLSYVIRDRDGSDYITRTLFPRALGVRLMLHRIHRPDNDRDLHNHPWRWALSIILCGSYDEQRLSLEGVRRVRWFNWLTDRDYHRIVRLHGEVWTLFIAGPKTQDWGFLVHGQHVPHAQYVTATKEK